MSKALIPKREINPGLIAALDHFASRHYRHDIQRQTLFRYTPPVAPDERLAPRQQDWTVERTCAVAHEILESYELHFLELMRLKAGLKELGLERAYEHITGEKLA